MTVAPAGAAAGPGLVAANSVNPVSRTAQPGCGEVVGYSRSASP